jgi:hypothetical protein
MQRRAFRRGERIIVKRSKYSDIRLGDIGIVTEKVGKGYAVQFTGNFWNAFHRQLYETRWIYFTAEEIELAPEAANPQPVR